MRDRSQNSRSHLSKSSLEHDNTPKSFETETSWHTGKVHPRLEQQSLLNHRTQGILATEESEALMRRETWYFILIHSTFDLAVPKKIPERSHRDTNSQLPMKPSNLRVEARASLPGFRQQTIVSNWYPQSSLCPRSLLELYGTSSVSCSHTMQLPTTAAEVGGVFRLIEQRKWHSQTVNVSSFFFAAVIVKWCERCNILQNSDRHTHPIQHHHIYQTHIPKASNLPSPKTQNSLQPNRAQWRSFHKPPS